VSLRVENGDELEVSPDPVPNLTPGVSTPLFVRGVADFAPGAPLLVSGSVLGREVDIAIEVEDCGELCGCLRALFAFETIRSLERCIDKEWCISCRGRRR
jgi:hypothetical protein